MNYFPIAVKLRDKKVLVIGGGTVAEREVQSLLQAHATVIVIAREAVTFLHVLAEEGKISIALRAVQEDDIISADLVIAATNDTTLNKQIYTWCQMKHILVNVVDNTALCDFMSPAIIEQDEALIAVYTDRKNPPLSRDLKNFLKENWDAFISYRAQS